MKNRLFSIFLMLFLVSTFYLPNTFAQNPTRWSLPEGAVARFGKGPATKTITFSPDGTQFGVGWKTGVWLYDAETYQEVALFTGGLSEIGTFAFSRDGATLVISGRTGSARFQGQMWDLATGLQKQVIDQVSRPIIFSLDGQTLLIGYGLWDVSTEQYLQRVPGLGNGSFRQLALSPDGLTLAGYFKQSNSRVVNLYLSDILTGQVVFLTGHQGTITSAAFSPDGQTIASGSNDKTIRVWDVTTGQIQNILTDHRAGVTSVTFSPDGSTLVSGSNDKTIRVWDATTGLLKRTLTGHEASIYRVALSPDGSILMSGSDDNAIYFWDVATGQHIETLREHVEAINSIAFSPDSTIIASERGRDILLWDVTTGLRKQTLTGHTGGVRSIIFSPDGGTLASGSDDGTVRLWDVATGQIQKILTERGGSTRGVAFSPDGQTLAGTTGGYIFLWDVATGLRKQVLRGVSNIISIAISPDGKTLASGNDDTTIHLWDVTTETKKQTLTGHGGPVNSITFGPDGKILASGSDDTTIRLWNVSTGQHLKTLVGHTSSVLNVSFSTDGFILMSGSTDKTVNLWNTLTGAQLGTQETPMAGSISTISFSPDSEILASGSENGIILLWGIPTLSVEVEPATPLSIQEEVDVNADGVVNIQDLVLVASNFGETGKNVADVNGDGIVNIEDLVKVAGALVNVAGAPVLWGRDLEVSLTRAEIHQWLQEARHINLTDPAFQRGVLILERLLAVFTPKETALLPNYPNPFNPETWIPYQLAESAEVSISIYAADGKLVRMLDLGYQHVGIYESRNNAAYWDGRNELGESVASGVYFYTLTAGDFTATRKMLIRK